MSRRTPKTAHSRSPLTPWRLQRQDALHKLTTDLTRRFTVIGIEDLSLRGMMANDRLARSIADMGFHEFRRQLEYKATMQGGAVVVGDRWFAGSKTCSCCEHKIETLPLSGREWTCPVCSASHDRDRNAAVNLKLMAVSSTAAACGEEGSGSGRKLRMKPASMKQEPGSKAIDAQSWIGMENGTRLQVSLSLLDGASTGFAFSWTAQEYSLRCCRRRLLRGDCIASRCR